MLKVGHLAFFMYRNTSTVDALFSVVRRLFIIYHLAFNICPYGDDYETFKTDYLG